MIISMESACVQGIQGKMVRVETDVVNGLPITELIGLNGKVANESKERVRSAIRNAEFSFPMQRIVIHVSPADLKKEGSHFDLPIALGILTASGQCRPKEEIRTFIWLGSLALNGEVQSIKGVLPMVLQAKQQGISGVVLPKANVAEALTVKGIRVIGVSHLKEAVFVTEHPEETIFDYKQEGYQAVTQKATSNPLDFSDIKGQEHVKRALEIAAAGNHACLLVGSPGSGKTALAKRLPGILPEMCHKEALETSVIYSISGRLESGNRLLYTRPFRAPHHGITGTALIGGGHVPIPGEISLAHNGVLFLDEINEMQAGVLELLREPMEDHFVRISRKEGTVQYPANFMLVAAANPCKCGMLFEERYTCTCTPREIARYGKQLSGALLDRIELRIEVKSTEIQTLRKSQVGETSREIRQRVALARQRQRERFAKETIQYNSQMTYAMAERYVPLKADAVALLQKYERRFVFSPRGYISVLRVARTIADLDGTDVCAEHVAEALQYRMPEQEGN